MASTIVPGAGSLVTALLAEIEKDREAKKHQKPGAPKKEQEKDEGSDSDADSDRSESPGPPDPRTCTVSGPGFAGGSAGAPVNLIITCKDEDGKRCKEGGDDVLIKVVPGSGVGSGSAPYVDVQVEDKGTGVYVATYTPPVKGMYNVTVEINGRELEGSPFPVFFGPPQEPSAAAAAPAAQDAATAASAASTALPATASLPPGMQLPSGLALPGIALPNAQPGGIDPATAAAVAASLSTHATLAAAGLGGGLAPGLAAANPLMAAAFPHLAGTAVPNVDPPARTLLVSNITDKITAEQLKGLFAVLGSVEHLQMLGSDMAMVEMATLQDAQVGWWGRWVQQDAVRGMTRP